MLTVGSLFSGAGGFEIAFDRAGMTTVWQSEIDHQCLEVLAHHWPDAEQLGDVRNVGEGTRTVDLICGGFPCTDVSVAGKRKGLAGSKSGLWFEFHRVLKELKPRWAVIENVTGLLSSGERRDFAVVVQGLADLGYLSAWRVFDAQYAGVAQRRRRVFIVGHLGDGRAAEVLFEREGRAWDPPPSRTTWPQTADTIGTSANRISGAQGGLAPQVIAASISSNPTGGKDCYVNNLIIAPTLTGTISDRNRRGWAPVNEADALIVCAPLLARRGGPDDNDAQAGHLIAAPLAAHHGRNSPEDTLIALGAWNWQSGGDVRHSFGKPSLSASQVPAIGVRRLMPIEHERLQGFPDHHTAVNGMSDSARYRMLGNAIAVPVAQWIGQRIMAAEGASSGE